MQEKIYDVAILGCGPAGITASIYAKRAGLDVVVVERNVPGGTVTTNFEVSNYTGFQKISGIELATKMFEHLQNNNVDIIWDEVKLVKTKEEIKTIECLSTTIKAKAVILCFGASVKKLGLENERNFVGRGLSYCATCDGNLFKDKTVALFGSSSESFEECLYLANIAKKVYFVYSNDIVSKQKEIFEKLSSKNNIEILLFSKVTKLFGEKFLEKIEVENRKTNEKRLLEVDGLFVCLGRGPNTDFIEGDLALSPKGYVLTDENMKTNLPGIFVAGDLRETPLRQIVTACSDGAIAGTKVFEFLKSKK